MSNQNLDQTKAGGGPRGSETGELNETDLESVAGGLLGIASRRTPIPDDGRSITGSPIPDDGRSLVGVPIPDDGRSITGGPVPEDGKS